MRFDFAATGWDGFPLSTLPIIAKLDLQLLQGFLGSSFTEESIKSDAVINSTAESDQPKNSLLSPRFNLTSPSPLFHSTTTPPSLAIDDPPELIFPSLTLPPLVTGDHAASSHVHL